MRPNPQKFLMENFIFCAVFHFHNYYQPLPRIYRLFREQHPFQFIMTLQFVISI